LAELSSGSSRISARFITAPILQNMQIVWTTGGLLRNEGHSRTKCFHPSEHTSASAKMLRFSAFPVLVNAVLMH
jgi:hypothetical protein